jgi:hypothetical protein
MSEKNNMFFEIFPTRWEQKEEAEENLNYRDQMYRFDPEEEKDIDKAGIIDHTLIQIDTAVKAGDWKQVHKRLSQLYDHAYRHGQQDLREDIKNALHTVF